MLRSTQQTLFTSLGLGVATAVASLLLTRALLVLLPRWGMVDRPDFKRHIHRTPVPRGGGLGMVVAFGAAVLIFFGCVLPNSEATFTEVLRLLAPLIVLVPLGIVDDKVGLKARTKFLFQTLASIIAWWAGFRLAGLFGLMLPDWICLPLTVIWIVGFINAFNMIDGVDGLAAGVATISATCMAVVALARGHNGFATLMFCFIGAMLGFLRYNWNPARVFMGDTGSMFIGYVLAVSGLVLNARLASAASIGIPVLACGIPIMDILFAVWRRILGNPLAAEATFPQDKVEEDGSGTDEKNRRGDGIFKRLVGLVNRLGTADQRHLHHRLLGYFNRNQRKTVWSIYLLALAMGGAAIGCCFSPQNKVTFTLVILLCTFAFIINRLAFIELWQTTELAYHNFQSAHAGVVISYIINPLLDLIIIVSSYNFAAQHTRLNAADTLRYTAILMAVLLTSRAYRVFWNLAVSDDYFRLIRTLLCGFLLARISDVFLPSSHVTRLHSYAACVAVSLIVLERLGIHYLRNWQVRRFGSSAFNRTSHTRTLLVGISPLTRFYRNRLLADIESAGNEILVGIVAQEQGFQHSYCYGMKVLGTPRNLERIITAHNINKVVMTAALAQEIQAQLQALCHDVGVTLVEFSCQETVR